MTSNINLTEFRNRLKNNTKIGSPSLKIPWGIFCFSNDNSKCFYGNFGNSTFELVSNSNFSPVYYVLKGTYFKTDENITVEYRFKPVGKLRIMYLKYFPIMASILCNSLFYFEIKPPIEIYILCNVFLIFISIISKVNIKWQKNKLERKFNKIFEITD